MRWAETCGLCAGLLLGSHAFADTPAYGKAQTFEPGKKYNCVPTADRKGWDCSESGKAAQPRAAAAAAAPAAPPPAETPSAQASAPQPAAASQKSGALPDYLTNAAAHGSTPPQEVPQAEPPAPPPAPATVANPAAAEEHPTAPAPSAPASTETKTVPPPMAQQPARPPAPVSENAEAAPAREPGRTRAPAPKPVAPPAAEHASPPSAVRAQPSAAGVQPAVSDFLALPGDQFVVELARAQSASDIAAQRSALQPPRGKVYELHLRQNGTESWLLVWGAFDSVEAARAARDELAAQGSVTPGWPRRIGPLQAEARRGTSE